MPASSGAPSTREILIDDHSLHVGDYCYCSQHLLIIFQDISNALNPRQLIGQLLHVPRRLNTTLNGVKREQAIDTKLRQVGLRPDHAYYYPHMLTPGQKQRGGALRRCFCSPRFSWRTKCCRR